MKKASPASCDGCLGQEDECVGTGPVAASAGPGVAPSPEGAEVASLGAVRLYQRIYSQWMRESVFATLFPPVPEPTRWQRLRGRIWWQWYKARCGLVAVLAKLLRVEEILGEE